MEDFAQVKKDFLDNFVAIGEMEEIQPELVFSWDQTGVKLVPFSNHTIEKEGSKRIEVAGITDKRLITAIFCGSLAYGDFLPLQVVHKGKTNTCHPKFWFPSDWNNTHSPNHWSTEKTMIQNVNEVIIPYVRSQRELLREEKVAVVIMDNLTGQNTASITALMEANDTDRLQPLHFALNKPAKDFVRRKFQEWCANENIKRLNEKDMETSMLEPIVLSSAVVKEVSGKWLVEFSWQNIFLTTHR